MHRLVCSYYFGYTILGESAICWKGWEKKVWLQQEHAGLQQAVGNIFWNYCCL